MRRRAFLLGSLAPVCVRAQHGSSPLGTLTYVQTDGLWTRQLPDGRPRRIVTGGTITSPCFSSSGRWILYTTGENHHVVSLDGTQEASLKGSGARWWPDRDDLLVEQLTGLSVFTAANRWNGPQWSIPSGTLPAVFSPDGA